MPAEEPLSYSGASIAKLFHASPPKVAKTAEDFKIPLHTGQHVAPLDLEAVKKLMLPRVRDRMEEVERLTFQAPVEGLPEGKYAAIPVADADALIANDIAEVVHGNVPITSVPFSVIEEKNGVQRRRLLIWCLVLNEFIKKKGYKAHVPLYHVSHYLDTVNEECGGTRDLSAGFFQYLIPRWARHLFTFKDASGRILQMTRLPMGLSSAPELMHTITATLAGDPLYAKPSASAPKGVTTKIWIDNVQATGGRAAVESYLQSFDATVARCKATLSADDSYCGTSYKFLGVIFKNL